MKELKNVFLLTLKEKRDVTLAVFFGFLAGIAGVALLASSGYLISKAALTNQMTTLVVMAACLKLFGLVAALSRYAERLFSHRATFTMLSHLRTSFFEKLSPQAPAIFHKYRSGDLLARIVGDVESLQNFLLRILYPPVVLAIVFLSTIFFASFFSIAIAAVLMIGLLVTVVMVPAIFSWKRRKMDSAVRESRSALSTETAEFLYGFRDLKIHQQLSDREKELTSIAKRYSAEQKREGLEENFGQSLNGTVSLLVSWAVLGLGAYLVASGQLDGLYLAMLAMISLAVFENVAPMAVFPAHFENNRKAALRLDGITEKSTTEERRGELAAGPLGVSLNHVSFHYPGELRPAIDEASLYIAPGTKTAIVGPSGSGKSTLMQLLLGIIKADNGTVTFGNQSISDISQEELWASMNIVLQENHFFHGTIRSNLLIANEQATDEQMVEALKKVQLDSFALSMKVEEKGGNLSGGEKQRLAIARALLKGGSFWLLDEPVSSVDNMTARRIYQQLFDRGANDTFVLISHELAGLEKMDQIIVMEQGRIKEAGSYDKLMAQKGYFHGLKQIEKSILSS
ncbi:thiol reductant ABC exporter subunit CydC [Planococcus salinus]|uniref:Thiol reductant ABC exporter subunit CydC n=1 Tax=Planococcus salinus TaxID=1848460 RepID=A0A3M8P6B8_9BACL|nr:thiol reductant ABC exporter subunit CydC [Planococcus salinus]RNF39217.1 thiol reductant ABC exporter subunit CydC [Planococcus salinus]